MVISFACCRFLLYAASLAFVCSPTSVEAFTGHATLFTAVKPTGVSLLRARATPSRGEWKLGTGVRLNTLTRSQHIISLSALSEDAEASSTPEEAAPKLPFRERWATIFPKQEGDKLPFRQRLAKMGLACVLSYGFVSNINSVVTTAIAWFVFAKRVSIDCEQLNDKSPTTLHFTDLRSCYRRLDSRLSHRVNGSLSWPYTLVSGSSTTLSAPPVLPWLWESVPTLTR
jgi:hypothetical protein